jgi:FkbH-like protein
MSQPGLRSPLYKLDKVPEPIRLVVWDLDDTLWRGTLTEGGIVLSEQHKSIVIALAQRGILSSICSKNNYNDAISVLQDHGISEYFVFPQINWDPKGPRLKALVDLMQLRPESVLFIDDNVSNLNEARHFVPGIQVADESVISFLLEHPYFAGKDDGELSRLKQYKIMEKKKGDQLLAAGQGTNDFLRQSEIVVTIDYDVERDLDRAIELINRTNQLNFTKRRLSQNMDEARIQLRELLSSYHVQAATISVRDKYGDYGIVGVYVESRLIQRGSGLVHYCFSCRILGMAIETWLYNILGRPPITVTGDVSANILEDNAEIDWVALRYSSDIPESQTAVAKVSSRIFFRGSCELLAVSHYFGTLASSVKGEYAFSRDDIQIRPEHSVMFCHAIDGVSAELLDSFVRLGFRAEDFETALFDLPNDSINPAWVLSFWADADLNVYRHKKTGALIPFNAFPAILRSIDFTKATLDEIEPFFRDHWIVGALETLREEYEFFGQIDGQLFKHNLYKIIKRVPTNGLVFIVGANEIDRPDSNGRATPIDHHITFNDYCRQVCSSFSNAIFISPSEFIISGDEIQDYYNHFDRKVYYRIFELIHKRLTIAAQ